MIFNDNAEKLWPAVVKQLNELLNRTEVTFLYTFKLLNLNDSYSYKYKKLSLTLTD